MIVNLLRRSHPVGAYFNFDGIQSGTHQVVSHLGSLDCFPGGRGVEKMEIVWIDSKIRTVSELAEMNGITCSKCTL